MLKKENRLTKKEFDEVFKKGKKKFSKNFIFIKLDDNKKIKISTTISKKIYKTAIQRNKSRRIIYKILQENWEKISEKNGEKEEQSQTLSSKIFWAILIATKPILEIDKKELEKEILKFL